MNNLETGVYVSFTTDGGKTIQYASPRTTDMMDWQGQINMAMK